jgi:hypothetical protein
LRRCWVLWRWGVEFGIVLHSSWTEESRSNLMSRWKWPTITSTTWDWITANIALRCNRMVFLLRAIPCNCRNMIVTHKIGIGTLANVRGEWLGNHFDQVAFPDIPYLRIQSNLEIGFDAPGILWLSSVSH